MRLESLDGNSCIWKKSWLTPCNCCQLHNMQIKWEFCATFILSDLDGFCEYHRHGYGYFEWDKTRKISKKPLKMKIHLAKDAVIASLFVLLQIRSPFIEISPLLVRKVFIRFPQTYDGNFEASSTSQEKLIMSFWSDTWGKLNVGQLIQLGDFHPVHMKICGMRRKVFKLSWKLFHVSHLSWNDLEALLKFKRKFIRLLPLPSRSKWSHEDEYKLWYITMTIDNYDNAELRFANVLAILNIM